MSSVESVRGPIDAAALGRVLMHEHIFILDPEFVDNYPDHDGFDEATEVPAAVARLRELKDAGIDTIVDLTVVGLGRYIPRIQKVAEQVDINIVVATGLYTYNELPHYVENRGRSSEEELLRELFEHDIVEGIARTGVKAGILKCATEMQGVTHGVEVVLRAVGRAHRATGVPISTHTHAATRRGLDQQDVFESEGVDLSRVVIGHSGDTTDVGYLEELIARGSYIGMDRFGLDAMLSFDDRVGTVATMCARGHADRMVLSHDAACFVYSVLINEYVLLAAEVPSSTSGLTPEQFHGLVDGMLRRPALAQDQPGKRSKRPKTTRPIPVIALDLRRE